uniref:Uncharacterized protein n=1 Tax=Hyaloperonospora arabidopsidis (strain Emoy2) TaxID=559515 RepID=M4BT38_HYAAE
MSQCHDEPIKARRRGLYAPGRPPQGRTQTALGHPTDRHGEIEPSTSNRDVDNVRVPHPRASRRGCGNAQKRRTLIPQTESDSFCPSPLQPLVDSQGDQRFLRGAYFDPPCREGGGGAANEISRLLARLSAITLELGASLSANDGCCWTRREVRRCSSDGQKDHRKRSARGAYRRIVNYHASWRRCEPFPGILLSQPASSWLYDSSTRHPTRGMEF